MKTLILNGSPRKNGDTMSLIKKFTEEIGGEYKLVNAYYCDISPCVDCRYCWEHEGCAINDGMQDVYDYIRDCDNILIASPVYFSELTGRLLDVGSRLQTYFCSRFFRKTEPDIKPKRGAVVLVGGGDGHLDKAYGTAVTLLHHMNCYDIHPLVFTHDTNDRPALDDGAAVDGITDIAEFFTERDR